MIVDILNQYGAEIISSVAVISTLAPFVRARIVSDKNIMTHFTDIKQMAQKINFKEIDINQTLDRFNTEVKILDTKINEEIQKIDESIIKFQEDEFYQKMLVGVESLNDLAETLKVKDKIILRLENKLKAIDKKLGELQNERKL